MANFMRNFNKNVLNFYMYYGTIAKDV